MNYFLKCLNQVFLMSTRNKLSWLNDKGIRSPSKMFDDTKCKHHQHNYQKSYHVKFIEFAHEFRHRENPLCWQWANAPCHEKKNDCQKKEVRIAIWAYLQYNYSVYFWFGRKRKIITCLRWLGEGLYTKVYNLPHG